MSFYDEVLEEKNKIDRHLRQGFVISAVKEDLSGAWMELTPPDDTQEQVTLLILTAEARTHLANQLLKQLRGA
jgi:hypothetical protein